MSTTHCVWKARLTTTSAASRSRRLAEGFAFIAVWMGLGYVLPGGAEIYLLVGIPLTIVFQVCVRRRPLRELWVREPVSRSPVDRRDVLVISLLALAPIYWGAHALETGNPVLIGWYAVALVGAAAATYSLRSTSVGAMLRSAAVPTAIGVIGNVLVIGGIQFASGNATDVVSLVGSVIKWTAIYFPATFIIEEVAFRGALDSHVHQPGEGRGWQSALFVSVLWGLWHLPVSDGLPFLVLVALLVIWHCVVGIPLSRAWRKSGNLAGPAFAHSAIDAVRNGLSGL